jgi:mono/diheme cytochrome c family protein
VLKNLRILLALGLLLVGGGIAVVLSGVVNVAATVQDPELVKAVLTQARERSIERRAKLIQAPKLGAPAQVALGLAEYREMCAACHGGPGREPSAIAQGLNPPPPQFSRSLLDDPAETFWVIQNGIKMTGMPAFGPTHDPETLWSIVAFLRTIDELTPEQKAQLARGAADEHEEGEHH